MSRLRFALVAAVALALPLLAAENSFAQWRFGWGVDYTRYGSTDTYTYPFSSYNTYPLTSYYNTPYSTYPFSSYNTYPFSSYYNTPYSTYPFSSYNTYPFSSYYNTPYSTYYTDNYPYTYTSPYVYSYYPYSTGSVFYSAAAFSPTRSGYTSVSGTDSTGRSSSTQAFYPPNAQSNTPAMIEVRVPADAQIWFDGKSTSLTGTERTFRSPPLQPGQYYSYEVKARWTENGKDIERTRKVRVHAGERVPINFMANEEEVGAPARSGS
jgi:uncharacterized protein (TIGR03000 family)